MTPGEARNFGRSPSGMPSMPFLIAWNVLTARSPGSKPMRLPESPASPASVTHQAPIAPTVLKTVYSVHSRLGLLEVTEVDRDERVVA